MKGFFLQNLIISESNVRHHTDFGVSSTPCNKREKTKHQYFVFALVTYYINIGQGFKTFSWLLSLHHILLKKKMAMKILEPLLNDIMPLETTGIKVQFENVIDHFMDETCMVCVEKVAAHALGGNFLQSIFSKFYSVT